MSNKRAFALILLILVAVCFLATPALAKKKKKRGKRGAEEITPPPAGEMMVGDWKCYYSPDFSSLKQTDRLMARSLALVYLQDFVTGKVMEGFKLRGESLTQFENAFLGRPELVEDFLPTNFAKCKAVGEGKLDPEVYLDYLKKLGWQLEAGQCHNPLAFEYHNFMDIQSDWQFKLHICEDDKILIETTGEKNGQFTVAAQDRLSKSRFITAEGDPEMMEAGEIGLVPELPLGAVIMRFEAEDDSYTKYFYVGHSLEFTAPAHGFVSFAINDTTYFDNKFRDASGAIDYLGLDIYPPVDQENTVEEALVP
jgi:hypothetical protein